MPLLFNATLGDAAANSAASLEYALTFCDQQFLGGVNAFTRLVDPDDQRRLLIRANTELELLESSLAGYRATTTQALSQPRIDGYGNCDASYVRADALAGTVIDPVWLDAQCARAIELAGESEASIAAATTTDPLAPFSEIEVAGIKLKMREQAVRAETLSYDLRRRLARFRMAGGLRLVRQ